MDSKVQVKVLCTHFIDAGTKQPVEDKWVGEIAAYVSIEKGDLIDCPIPEHQGDGADMHSAEVIDV